MTAIGVYDSGIGGLTTLAHMKNIIRNADFYYFADNGNMPLGLKNETEAEQIVRRGVKMLEAHSDCSVLACNTASITTRETEVFKLLPTLSDLDPKSTLVLATPLTLSRLQARENFYNTADTGELASLVEIQASLCYKSRSRLDFSALGDYLAERIGRFSGVDTVVLGCSHYIYLKDEIRKILGDVKFADGNEKLVKAVGAFYTDGIGNGKIRYAFSGANETAKYQYILDILQKALIFKG